MLTLRQLQAFEAVARLASYSKAAEELGVSQPSVSVQVQELEKGIGARVFDRPGRRTQLSEIGRALYPHATAVLAAADRARETVDAFLGLDQGRVRVGATETFGLYRLPNVIRAFSGSHPGVEVELSLEPHDLLESALDRGELDLVYSESQGKGAIESRQVDAAELAVIVARDHPLALQQRAPASAFEEDRFIIESPGSVSADGAAWIGANLARGTASVAMEVGSVEALKQMVRAGLGVGVTPAWAVDAEVRAGQVHRLTVNDLDGVRPIYELRRGSEELTPAAQAFAETAACAFE